MIGVYVRVSGESQDDNYSMREQRDRGIKFAESQKEDFKVYEDVFTGTTLDRPSLQLLLSDIKAGIINKIWIIEFTRLSRDTIGAHTLKDILSQYNVEIYINDVLTKIENPEEYLMFGINTVISEYEKRRIVERNQRGANRRRREGGRWCSNPPYGYEAYYTEKGERKIRIKEDEMPNVIDIFDRYVNKGQSIKQITADYNNRLIKFRGAKEWYWSDVNRILKQTLYAGFYNFEDKEVESYVYPKVIERDFVPFQQDSYHSSISLSYSMMRL